MLRMEKDYLEIPAECSEEWDPTDAESSIVYRHAVKHEAVQSFSSGVNPPWRNPLAEPPPPGNLADYIHRSVPGNVSRYTVRVCFAHQGTKSSSGLSFCKHLLFAAIAEASRSRGYPEVPTSSWMRPQSIEMRKAIVAG